MEMKAQVQVSDENAMDLGNKVIKLLDLQLCGNLVDTTSGKKTPLGLGCLILRLVESSLDDGLTFDRK